ncbi:MAG: pantoate--beta-alanine ligase [Deltaproteobacteria bacterium]|nr:pantoate--beta-alanine ligase [Deltaproteobacteria bacterium]
MRTCNDPDDVTAWARSWRSEGARVGFVPTMGFLHRGHASLLDLAHARCDRVVVSIYVNPLQFGPSEDLDRYPRDPEGDLRLCAAHGVDLAFLPETLYPPGFSTRVRVEGLTSVLCGAARRGHFEGVTTVVARLFGIVGPCTSVFGEKDWQQYVVVRRMAEDLHPGVEVVAGPLVRDDDGLALSSRNRYLSAADRVRALSLHRALRAIRDSREPSVPALLEEGRSLLEVDRLDYIAIVDPWSLAPLERVDRPARALVAAFVGNTRLIDNVAVDPR